MTMTENQTDESVGHEHDETAELTAVDETSGEVLHLDERDIAILRAGRAELERSLSTQPGMPDPGEFARMCQMAVMFAEADGAPKDVRGKPFNAFLKLMTGRDLGLGITASMRQIHTFDGNLTFAAELTRMLIERHGMGTIMPAPGNDRYRAAVIPFGPDGPDKRCVRRTLKTPDTTVFLHFEDPETGDCECDLLGPEIVFTWQDAQVAALVSSKCTPDEHVCWKSEHKGPKCKDNWKNYPQDMLYARASSAAQRRYYAGATAGLYDPDEIGAVVDAQGNIIDLDSVELPPGYDAKRRGLGRGQRQEQEGVRPIDPGDLLALQVILEDLKHRADADDDVALGGDKSESAKDRLAKVLDTWKRQYGVKAETLTLAQGDAALARIKGMVPDWEARLAVFVEWAGAAPAVDDAEAPADDGPQPDDDGAASAPEASDSDETAAEAPPSLMLDTDAPEIQKIAQRAMELPEVMRSAIWEEVKTVQPADVHFELAAAGLPNAGKANELRMLLAAHRAIVKLDDPGSAKAIKVARQLEDQMEEAEGDGDQETLL